MISKMSSPAKPGAGFTLFNTLLCKQQIFLTNKAYMGQQTWSPWLERERGLLDFGIKQQKEPALVYLPLDFLLCKKSVPHPNKYDPLLPFFWHFGLVSLFAVSLRTAREITSDAGNRRYWERKEGGPTKWCYPPTHQNLEVLLSDYSTSMTMWY